MDLTQLKPLIARLSEPIKKSLEEAAGFCVSRRNYSIEVEHCLLKLLDVPSTDIEALCRFYEIDRNLVTRDLVRAIDRLRRGATRSPTISEDVVKMLRAAWMVASIEFGARAIRSAHLLVALLADDELARILLEASDEFQKVTADAVRRDFRAVCGDTREIVARAPAGADEEGAPAGPDAPPSLAGESALAQYTIDLTGQAKAGRIDPIVGRDREIRQTIDILTRRRQNNPILTGEAGVGKTAVVEGFALRIVAGDVPDALKDVSIRTLDLGLLQAGAGIKGEFESRLKSVIDEVKASPRPIILFIDEAHTMIGAGGAAGQSDAANLLKPALARGELRTIAATTWAEYKKYFEKDAALARRFQVVQVDEPDDENAVRMMRAVARTFERHHGVTILDDALIDAVKLSKRYISGRHLPDKCIGVLDTACARVGMSQHATPAAVEDVRRRLQDIEVTSGILQREQETGVDHRAALATLAAEKEREIGRLEEIEARWKRELELVGRMREHHAALTGDGDGEIEGAPARRGAVDAAARRDDLRRLAGELAEVQGDDPLVHACVGGAAVADVISGWTGIPVGRMVKDEVASVLALKDRLEERVVGQPHALEEVARRIRTSRARMSDPRRPIGVFLMVGPSGVGKTETAISLAEILYGGVESMTVINMSEFKEEHKVSLLMGSPPGYVGYGEGGVLTEAVRRRPYSVVLLDEMEKAHPGVQDLFYQVFDKGTLRDGEGRDIDFKNTVVIMTSNAGSDLVHKLCADPETAPDADGLVEALRPKLLETFKPAFLGRLTLVPYLPLPPNVLKTITRMQLERIAGRVRDNYGATCAWDDALVDAIVDRCSEVDTGARNIDHILTRTLLPELSTHLLARLAQSDAVRHVAVGASGDGFVYEVVA